MVVGRLSRSTSTRSTALPKGINYAAYMGHSALRTYVMGERAFIEEATEEDLPVDEARGARRDPRRRHRLHHLAQRNHQTPTDIRSPAASPIGTRSGNWSA